jgi:hypothetical protein
MHTDTNARREERDVSNRVNEKEEHNKNQANPELAEYPGKEQDEKIGETHRKNKHK